MRLVWLVVSGFVLAGGSVAQVTVDLVAVKDNTLFESPTGATSNGAGPTVFTGRTQSGFRKRALVRFEPAASIPVGSVILSATLRMNLEQNNGGGTFVSLRRVQQDWGEAGSVSSALGGGAGAPAQPGDATWLHTFSPSAFWSSVGGDFSPFTSASALVGPVNQAYQWSTAAMASDVQSWLDNPAQNFGWVLITPETSGNATRFSSREAAAPIDRPGLRVVYAEPYPGSGDDLTLEVGVNGPVGSGAVVVVSPGDDLSLTVDCPLGTYVGFPPILAGQLFATGSPPTPPSGFPEIHLDPGANPPPFVVFDGSATPLGPLAIPFGGLDLLFPSLPPVPPGQSVILQAIVYASGANNGIFAITRGAELRF